MTSIIQKVSFEQEEAKRLTAKLAEHLGIHRLTIALSDGGNIEGILSEVGKDYICIIEGECDIVVPIKNISFLRYSR